MTPPTSRLLQLLLAASITLAGFVLAPARGQAQVTIQQVPPPRAATYSVSATPERPRYQAPEHHDGHPLWGLFVPSIILFGVSYLTTIGVTAAISSNGGDIGINAIPWAGPWVCLAACRRPGPYAWSLILSGTLQAVTTILWIIGAAVRVGGDEGSALLEQDGVRFTPWASADGAGLAMDVSF
jgi:hypothetical protein